MTLEKLAKIAHVSISTVSKAFSASPEVSAETRRYIFDIAKEHGCFEKYYKEKYDKKVIAVICPEIRSAYYADFVTHLERVIDAHNHTMLLSVTNFDLQKEMDIAYYYRCFAKADGIVVIGGTALRPSENIPTVGIFSENKTDPNMDVILTRGNGIWDAVRCLKANGHTNIAFFGEKFTSFKEQLFRRAMSSCSLPVREENIVISDRRFEQAGVECAAAWLALPLSRRPTAVLAAYDYMAIGVMDFLADHGLSVPRDLSLIGMDNIGAADYKGIRLSSVKTDFEGISHAAVAMLEEKMNNPAIKVFNELRFDSVLIERDSVACIKERKQP